MHDGQDNRARQTEIIPRLGDPERWGGTVVWTATLPAGVPVPGARALYSQQIVRMQQPNLLARSWDVFASYDIAGTIPGNVFDVFGLEIITGVGQSSGTGVMVLRSGTGVNSEGRFFASATEGAVQLERPLPATAIAIRGYLLGAAGLGNPDTPLTISLTVAIAPRALH